MTINDVVALVSNLAFPIVCCVALFWKMDKQDEEHKEEVSKLTNAIFNNTEVMNKLAMMIEELKNDR